MSDKKSASRRIASVPNALVDGRTFQQEEVPMARDLAVRAMRALLVALGCFVVCFWISVPEASARSAVVQHGCHHQSNTSCRQDRALTEHAKKAHDTKVRAAVRSAREAASKAVQKSAHQSPMTQPNGGDQAAQHPGTDTALPRPSTSTSPAPIAESSAASPAAGAAVAIAGALVNFSNAPAPPLLNPAPTPGAQSPGAATRATSAPSSAPRTPSTSPAFAAALDLPRSQSLFGIDDSPLLVAELLVFALGVAAMVAGAGRRGRRTH